MAGEAPRPDPLPPAPLASGLARMDSLLHGTIAGPHGRRLRAAPQAPLQAWTRLAAAGELQP